MRPSTVVLAALFLSSCATRTLWEATDRDRMSALPLDSVTAAQLEREGRPYLLDESAGVLLVGRTPLERAGDHGLRFLATPVTICVDVAPSVGTAVLKGVLDGLAAESGGHPSN